MPVSTPIPTKTHAPREYFLYWHKITVRQMNFVLTAAGWKSKWKPTVQAIDQGWVVVSNIKGSRYNRNLYHKETLSQILIDAGYDGVSWKPKKDPVKSALNLIEEVRKTRPNRRKSIMPEVQKAITALPQTELPRFAIELRKRGIDPQKPLADARIK